MAGLKFKTGKRPDETPSRSKYAEPKTMSVQNVQHRGKRGNPDYDQISGLVPKRLKLAWKSKLAAREEDMSMALERLLTADLEADPKAAVWLSMMDEEN